MKGRFLQYAALLCALLSAAGCAERRKAPAVYVDIDVPAAGEAPRIVVGAEADRAEVFIQLTAPTPAPVVTPAPTPSPAPEKPREKPRAGKKPKDTPRAGKKPKESPKADKKPKDKPKPRTPHGGSYKAVKLRDYGAKLRPFSTLALDGSTVTDGYIAGSELTLVNVWSTT